MQDEDNNIHKLYINGGRDGSTGSKNKLKIYGELGKEETFILL
jgi:hypothetical protein